MIEFRQIEEQWQISENDRPAPSAKRPYTAGAAANLYEGEPLLIVYGTTSKNPNRIRELETAAQRLALCGGPVYSKMIHTRFPVVADSALTTEQEARCNLLLVGGPSDNSVTQRVLPGLPIRMEKGHIMVGQRTPLALDGQVLSLLHPHPSHPSRLLYLLAPFSKSKVLPARFTTEPQRFLAGSPGFHRIEQADLLVQDFAHKVSREMQFGHDWELVFPESESQKIPARFKDRNEMVLAYLKVMKQKSKADFAFWWGPTDKGMWGVDFNYLKSYDPEYYSLADFRTKKRIAETMTGDVSGIDLQKIHARRIAQKEITPFPKIDLESIVLARTYRIHIPMNMYIKLGQRKKNLGNPQPGPEISGKVSEEEKFAPQSHRFALLNHSPNTRLQIHRLFSATAPNRAEYSKTNVANYQSASPLIYGGGAHLAGS